ncbi:hypothetical protein [Neorhizobium galegae]|uniref:hypothetical protein n=1 Tax=Neorhizobium galegae TaxID=399 RepID=UPI002105D747|nr:hypothetical protein [Neorhizobium galegae]MCQ1855759.1 hypothetical protein [Neorhizobium galegae]
MGIRSYRAVTGHWALRLPLRTASEKPYPSVKSFGGMTRISSRWGNGDLPTYVGLA